MSGVAVGVMALIIVIGVMTGFTQELRQKILSVNADILVLKLGGPFTSYQKEVAEIEAVPGVVSVAPFIYTQVMFSAPGNISAGVIRGLDPKAIRSGGPKGLKVIQGQFTDLAEFAPEEPPPRYRHRNGPQSQSQTGRLPEHHLPLGEPDSHGAPASNEALPGERRILLRHV